MKIAVIAPPWIPVPPKGYGGIELVVYNLVEGLTELGQEVILFAPKDSDVSCRLIPYIETPLEFGLNSSEREKAFVSELVSKYAYAMAGYEGVDIIHDHTLSLSRVSIPSVHTLHGPATEATVKRCVELSQDPKNSFVSISDRQRELYLKINSSINFAATVHNCVNTLQVPYREEKEDFFLFAGRANWEKGLDLAIRVASKAGVGLVMAVKMTEDFEKEFFKKEIQPWIEKYPKNLLFQFHEEISRSMLEDLFQRAKGVLFTSQWEEPFGLVMIEAMACGTPVIALNRGAAPEVIVDGKTGFIVNSEEQMIKAVKKINRIKPADCRAHVEQNFSRQKMARDYLDVYKKIIESKQQYRKAS